MDHHTFYQRVQRVCSEKATTRSPCFPCRPHYTPITITHFTTQTNPRPIYIRGQRHLAKKQPTKCGTCIPCRPHYTSIIITHFTTQTNPGPRCIRGQRHLIKTTNQMWHMHTMPTALLSMNATYSITLTISGSSCIGIQRHPIKTGKPL
jgi:hypothetical protein